MGQGELGVALQQVLISPVLLATIAGMLLSVLQLSPPPTVRLLVRHCCIFSKCMHSHTLNFALSGNAQCVLLDSRAVGQFVT